MKKLFLFLFLFSVIYPAYSQRNKKRKTDEPLVVDTSLYNSMYWRSIGPFRGGRSAAVTGVPGEPNLFYFGGTGGGVWRTQDGGRTWENISDPYFGGSIGSVSVADSDHNVIYVGGGEVTVRGNVSYGSGMWKTTDAGRSWKSVGLKNSRHIPRIQIHPKNPDLVYAAVLGDLFKSSEERGVYRSSDGGETWEKIHFVNADAGAVDLCMDPTNPRILYASFWRVRRSPWSLSSGGEGSSLWKSTDGGETWTELTKNEGMPTDTIGIIGVSVSAAQPDRVYAIVESQTGGVFRSDNAGKTWRKVNESRSLRQRAWYYSSIHAHPKDPDQVYVMNVAYHHSKDGGRSFARRRAPHGDHHKLWIAPDDPKRMIIGDDGGAQITYDGGKTWSTYHNQPTAQFYRINVDNSFPYRIYVAQQDNSTLRIPHRTNGGRISERDWEPTAGGESGHIAIDPRNNDIVYGGSYHGYLTRKDHGRKTNRLINVWPEDNMGHGAEDAKYRFQWNFPIFISPHDPEKLYVASNHLHLSTNEGQSWETISPDLTTNDKDKQRSSGGPITQDNTSVEYYCTIFAAAESPLQEGVIWTGSDDGRVHVTTDGGQNWNDITPPDLPEWTQVNSLDPDPFNAGGCYLACTGYRLGDYKPYIFYTSDYGASWKKLVKGIDPGHFTRVVRADPARKGLLYAGTEEGMYVSFDNGANWQGFQLNLPIVPITDLIVKDNNLVAATQGRSIWLIDDLTPVRNQQEVGEKASHLYAPAPTYRMGGGGSGKASRTAGANRQNGVFFHYYLKEEPGKKDTVALHIMSEEGDTIRTYSNLDKKNNLKPKAGSNLFVWNMRYPDAERFDGLILWSYSLRGPKAIPGKYKATLQVGNATETKEFVILPDPRSESTQAEMQVQLDFVQDVSEKISELHKTVKDIRKLRGQMKGLKGQVPKDSLHQPLLDQLQEMDSVMTSVEEAIYQTKNRSAQDPLNFPVRLNDKLANLMGLNVGGDFPPTAQSIQVKEMLFELADTELEKWNRLKSEQLPEINRLIHELEIDILK